MDLLGMARSGVKYEQPGMIEHFIGKSKTATKSGDRPEPAGPPQAFA